MAWCVIALIDGMLRVGSMFGSFEVVGVAIHVSGVWGRRADTGEED